MKPNILYRVITSVRIFVETNYQEYYISNQNTVTSLKAIQ